MSNVEFVEKQEEKEDRVTELRIIPGGKEPPTEVNCWLDKVEKGTNFVVKDKTNLRDFQLTLFVLIDRYERTVVLANPQVPNPILVDPQQFCNKFSLFEDLGTVREPKEEETTIKE